MSLNTKDYVYRLRFSIDKDAPPDYMERWSIFKKYCENGKSDKNQLVVNQIKENCQLPLLKGLPYLNRSEGGIGGNDNQKNKQIRFRDGFMYNQKHMEWQYDNDIVLDQICSTETEQWTYEEMNDLLSAFIKVSEYYAHYEGCGCVRGWIEMIPKEMYRY